MAADLDAGRVGVATTRPAEFTVVEVTLATADAGDYTPSTVER
ncbi:MAG: hypothetical protein ABEI39_01290 [Halobacteriales archaeon]